MRYVWRKLTLLVTFARAQALRGEDHVPVSHHAMCRLKPRRNNVLLYRLGIPLGAIIYAVSLQHPPEESGYLVRVLECAQAVSEVEKQSKVFHI